MKIFYVMSLDIRENQFLFGLKLSCQYLDLLKIKLRSQTFVLVWGSNKKVSKKKRMSKKRCYLIGVCKLQYDKFIET